MEEFTLKFTGLELNVVVACLGEMPYKQVSGVISSIQRQIKEAAED
jgi:hypothetical protein